MTRFVLPFCLIFFTSACVGPTPGPDKAGEQLLLGAASGAGSGAVTGAQLSAGSGVGALVGAGFGATAGFIRGITQDQFEERLLRMSESLRRERALSYAQQVLVEHYQRRQELHPTRDIFPAEIFFRGDESQLRMTAYPILEELVRLNKDRLAWSRLAVASYVRSNEEEEEDPAGEDSDQGKEEVDTEANDTFLRPSYAQHLAEKRAEAIGDAFVRLGLEPRRIVARPVIVREPILIDPHDRIDRYNQAIELIPLDR